MRTCLRLAARPQKLWLTGARNKVGQAKGAFGRAMTELSEKFVLDL